MTLRGPTTMSSLSLADIRRAAERIRDDVLHTPLLPWDEKAWLKPESLQPTGAFKIRGAYNKIRSLTASERSRGLITHSSGNHGAAVARAARDLGIHAVVCMPRTAPEVKIRRVRGYGATVILTGPGSDDRRFTAIRLATERGYTLIAPYDDLDVIAGQGTCGLEIVADLPSVTSIVVPIGGGGLAAGIVTAVKAASPMTRIIGVEPALAADAKESLASGRLTSWPRELATRTIADGLQHQSLGELAFELLRSRIDVIVTVSEEEIIAAVGRLAWDARLVVEPSGAVAMAAHLSGSIPIVAGDDVRVIIVSGGNVEPRTFRAILRPAALNDVAMDGQDQGMT